MQGRSHGCRKPWQVRWLSQCAPESDCNDVEHEEALVGHEHTQDSNLLRARSIFSKGLSKVCRHHGGTEWYGRAEDDVTAGVRDLATELMNDFAPPTTTTSSPTLLMHEPADLPQKLPALVLPPAASEQIVHISGT